MATTGMAGPMCEHCDEPSLYSTERAVLQAAPESGAAEPESPTGRAESPWGECQGFDEDDEEDELILCALEPRWLVEDTSPGDHYCEQHKAEYLAGVAARSDMEVAELHTELEGKGLLAVTRAEECGEVTGDAAAGVGLCGRPATWVAVETWQLLLCDRHAREWAPDARPEDAPQVSPRGAS